MLSGNCFEKLWVVDGEREEKLFVRGWAYHCDVLICIVCTVYSKCKSSSGVRVDLYERLYWSE